MKKYSKNFVGGISHEEIDSVNIESENTKILVIIVQPEVLGTTTEQRTETIKRIVQDKILVYDEINYLDPMIPTIIEIDSKFTVISKHSPNYIEDICLDISNKSEELNSHFNENIEEALEVIDNNYLLSENVREQQEQSKEDILKAIDNIE